MQGLMFIILLAILPIQVLSTPINYSHRIGFEENDQCMTQSEVIYWGKKSRDNIKKPRDKISSYSEKIAPHITALWSRDGRCSARCTSIFENPARQKKARCMFQLVGNKRKGIERTLRMNKDYWIGFSLKNDTGRLASNWELYFQIHNNAPSARGWGNTKNPMIALERTSSDRYRIVYRYNTNTKETIARTADIGKINTIGYTDFMLKIRLSNPDANGILKVWKRDEGKDVESVLELEDIRLGYYREKNQHSPVVAFGVYNGGKAAEGRIAYFDNISVSSDIDANRNSVDPEFFSMNESVTE